MQLRDYQQVTSERCIAAIDAGKDPCAVLPGATGKSVVVAELCWVVVTVRGKRVLMLTHVKELVAQNVDKLVKLFRHRFGGEYPPLGIYSASLKRKQLGRAITYASIQSVAPLLRKLGPTALGWIDVVIIDEAHLIPTKGEGQYRTVLAVLRQMNPDLRVIGLTATPWRLGHGSIADGEGALFNELLDGILSVREGVERGFTAPLRSKHTEVQLLELVGEVSKRGGDYIESELAAAINLNEPNEKIAAEIVARMNAEDRRHGLLFCCSVAHAQEMARIMTFLGAPCGVVHGNLSDLERTDVLTRLRVGELRAVANVNILTTGYDFPDLDCMAFIRPTLSPTLYMQIGFRGMRLKVDGTTPHNDCLVLDFAGLVRTHGPITDVRPPRAKGAAKGEMPIKTCPVCSELVMISCLVCPSCGHEWEAPVQKVKLHTDDIMGERDPDGLARVDSWFWYQHQATTGKKMLAVEYRFAERVQPIGEAASARPRQVAKEYFPVFTDEWARSKLKKLAEKCGVDVCPVTSILLDRLNDASPPATVMLTMKGDWLRVGKHKWPAASEEAKQEETAA